MKQVKWKEDPVLIGAMAGSGMFKWKIKGHKKLYPLNYGNALNFLEEEALLEDCTLIARSIDSLTEEELDKIVGLARFTGDETWKEHVERERKFFEETIGKEFNYDLKTNITLFAGWTDIFLYLLSIGVLPPTISTEGVEFEDEDEVNICNECDENGQAYIPFSKPLRKDKCWVCGGEKFMIKNKGERK